MPERTFLCYAGSEAEYRDGLALALRAVEGSSLSLFVDVRIAPGTAWLPQLREALATCSVGIILVSNALLVSDFIRGIELPELLARWRTGRVTLLVVHVYSSVWEQAVPQLGDAQWPLRGRPALAKMGEADRQEAYSQVASDALIAARAAPTVRRWLDEGLDAKTMRSRWRACVGDGVEPQAGGRKEDVARALAFDLADRGIEDAPLPSHPAGRPIVRVRITRVPARPDTWAVSAQVVFDHDEPRPLRTTQSIVTTGDLARVLDFVFTDDCPAVSSLSRLEVVTDVATGEVDPRSWQVEELGERRAFYAPIVLRDYRRYIRSKWWDALALRSSARWNERRVGLGPGGRGCTAPSQLASAAVVDDAARTQYEGNGAIAVGLLSLAQTGRERERRINEIVRWGIPVAVWGPDSVVEDVLRKHAPQDLREVLYESDRPRSVSLLFDDPHDPIDMNYFEPP